MTPFDNMRDGLLAARRRYDEAPSVEAKREGLRASLMLLVRMAEANFGAEVALPLLDLNADLAGLDSGGVAPLLRPSKPQGPGRPREPARDAHWATACACVDALACDHPTGTAGAIAEVAGELGISAAALSTWRAKLPGEKSDEARRLHSEMRTAICAADDRRSAVLAVLKNLGASFRK